MVKYCRCPTSIVGWQSSSLPSAIWIPVTPIPIWACSLAEPTASPRTLQTFSYLLETFFPSCCPLPTQWLCWALCAFLWPTPPPSPPTLFMAPSSPPRASEHTSKTTPSTQFCSLSFYSLSSLEMAIKTSEYCPQRANTILDCAGCSVHEQNEFRRKRLSQVKSLLLWISDSIVLNVMPHTLILVAKLL